MIGFFKRLLARASGESLLSRMEAAGDPIGDTSFTPRPLGYGAFQQASKEDIAALNAMYHDPYAAARIRLQSRGVEIARLRRNKKRFSHLVIEQKKDQEFIAARQRQMYADMQQAR